MLSRLRTGPLSSSRRLWSICACVLFMPIIALCGTKKAPATSGDSGHDLIVFVNGDRLTGQFVGATQSSVEFEGRFTGTLSFAWSDVKELTVTEATLAVTIKSSLDINTPKNFTVTEPVMENEGTDLVFRRGGAESLRVPLSQLDSATPQRPARWKGTLQSQDSIIGATQKQYQLGGALHITRATQDKRTFKHQVTDINIQASFGESKNSGASPVRTALYDGLFQQNIFIRDNPSGAYGGPYVFVLTDFYHNLSLGMNIEQTYGGGVGWDRQYGRHIFGFGADVRYVNENIYSPGKSLNLAGAGLGEHDSYTLPWPKKNPFTLFERITFVPAFNESHAFQARGIAGLDMPISGRFSVGVQDTDDYLRNAPANSNQNYSSVQLTLSYTIGPLPPKRP